MLSSTKRTLAGLTLLRRLVIGAALAKAETQSKYIVIKIENILLIFIENFLLNIKERLPFQGELSASL